MNEYYFLFGIALVYVIIAVIEDLKTTEVSNWLNFTLVAFALAYRFFYSFSINSYEFFFFGVVGFSLFFGFGLVFYYSKVFGGGDAKLLAGIGAVLPYMSYIGVIYTGFVFMLFLFGFGAIWSLVYSLRVVYKNKKKFNNEINKNFKKRKVIVVIAGILLISCLILIKPFYFAVLVGGGIFVIPLIWVYVNSLERCMIVLTRPEELIEGDWLEKEVRLGKRTIEKSVHGLSEKDIKLLKKYGKKVLVKQGVPFTPAFLLSLLFMEFSYLVLNALFFRVFAF